MPAPAIAVVIAPTTADAAVRRRLPIAQRLFRLHADDALPLAIEHQRIYILPTRRGWAFLAALLLMLLASVNYALSLGYALSFLLSGLFAASLLHTYRNLAGLELSAVRGADGFAGEPIAFEAKLTDHDTRTRRGIRIVTRNAESMTIADVASGATVTARLRLRSRQRGPLALGRLTIDSDWPLGLWRAWSYAHAPVHATVYPAPEDAPPPLPRRAGVAGPGLAVRARDGDVAGLRAYEPGDTPSRIAWKSAARGTPLQVRLMESSAGPARIELDLASTALHELEVRLSRLSAWVLVADQTGNRFSLDLPGVPTLVMGDGGVHRRHALNLLANYRLPNERLPS